MISFGCLSLVLKIPLPRLISDVLAEGADCTGFAVLLLNIKSHFSRFAVGDNSVNKLSLGSGLGTNSDTISLVILAATV